MSKLWQKHLETLMSDEANVESYVNVAGAVVTKEGDNGEQLVLLIRRAPDDHWPLHWEFPRGKCDKGPNEPLVDCVKRETKEEAGIDIEPITFIDKFDYIADRGTRKSTQYNYLCRMKNPKQKIVLKKTPGGVQEHDEYRWIQSVGEAELLVHPECKKTISKVLNPETQIVDYGDSQTKIEETNTMNQVEEYLQVLEGDMLSEADFKRIISKLNPKTVFKNMAGAVKRGDTDAVKKVTKTLPKKTLIKPLLQKAVRGHEEEFKESQSHFRKVFRTMKNDKMVTNMSNAMACLSVATNKDDIKANNKKISSKIEATMRKKKISESEELSEFIFPTIAVKVGDNVGSTILNIVIGVLQVIGELALMGGAAALFASGPGVFVAPILIFICLWLVWACLPENLQDMWVVIPI